MKGQDWKIETSRKEELIRGLSVTPSPCHQKGKRNAYRASYSNLIRKAIAAIQIFLLCLRFRYALCAMPYAIRAGPTFLWMILNPNIPSLTPKLPQSLASLQSAI
jgi:hypothetical protein